MTPLVSTAFVAEALGKPDFVVLDASFYLPTEARDPRVEFAAGHIPGARIFDLDVIADHTSPLPHMLPTAGVFGRAMGALGIGAGTRVVFYDQKGLFSAARGWWMMRLFGHRDVAVLDGGLPKWRAEGRPVETGEPAAVVPVAYEAEPDNRLVRGLGDVWRTVETHDAILLDARGAARFNGTVPEPRPGLPSGHIPGALNLPFTELLNPDGTMLTPEALRARFAALGVDGARPVITSCGTGVTATVLTLGMVVAGLPPGAVYDGSWTEWASRADTPKA